MSLASTVDPAVRRATEPSVRELLVLWQHPETRRFHPIGRFAFDGTEYEFAYTRHAMTIADFRPLPGLPLRADSYRGQRMPTFFQERTMAPSRPDFVARMLSIQVDPELATPWEQIVHSGGRRAGDTLQFMQFPEITGSQLCCRFFVNGVRHVPNGMTRIVDGAPTLVTPDEQERALSTLQPRQRLDLVLEAENPEDENAVMISSGGTPLGWVPRILSAGVRDLMGREPCMGVSVVRTAGASASPHVRLVVDLEAEVPHGFTFDPEGEWESFAV